MGLTDAQLGQKCRQLLFESMNPRIRYAKLIGLANECDPPDPARTPLPAPAAPPERAAAEEGADVSPAKKKTTRKKARARGAD